MNALGKIVLSDGREAVLTERWQWESDDPGLLEYLKEHFRSQSPHWDCREYLEWVAFELGGTAEVYRDHALTVPPGAIV